MECRSALKKAHIEFREGDVKEEVILLAREVLKAVGLRVVDDEGLCAFDGTGFLYVLPKYAGCDPMRN